MISSIIESIKSFIKEQIIAIILACLILAFGTFRTFSVKSNKSTKQAKLSVKGKIGTKTKNAKSVSKRTTQSSYTIKASMHSLSR